MCDETAILSRLADLAGLTDVAGGTTRLAFGPALRAANALVLRWMRDAGMDARTDAAGNVVGRYEATHPGAPALLLGSHLDTVPDAGRFDGMLGVVVAIACVAALARDGRRFPFAIEVVGFNDEEGVRFGSVGAGSRAMAGRFEADWLARRDAGGTSARDATADFGIDPDRIGDAARRPEDVLAYVELHIEQGPVLHQHGLALGCVTSITGARSLSVTIEGQAGHAGTVPMAGRHDALAAAAACILAVEAIGRETGIVATVGEIEVVHGAANVIPGRVRFSADLRSGDGPLLARATDRAEAEFDTIARARGVQLVVRCLSQRSPTACAASVMRQIDAAIIAVQGRTLHLASGAGHDGVFMAGIAPIGMLFLRCTDGISHHPAEEATMADIEAGVAALMHVITAFQQPAGAAP